MDDPGADPQVFDAKWGKKLPEVAEANSLVLKAGYNLGDTLRLPATAIKFPRLLHVQGLSQDFRQ